MISPKITRVHACTEEGLEQSLVELYQGILKYNALVDQTLSLGEFRTKKHFMNLNLEREELCTVAEKIVDKLSNLRLRIIT